MGWVGVGVLIATAAYFLYRYPPRSWAEPRSFAPPDPNPDAPVAAATADDPVQRKHGSGATIPSLVAEEEEGDSQITPKAAASSAPLPVLAVPTFSLDSGERETSQPAPVPSISQTMNGTAKQVFPTNRDNAAPRFQPPPQPSLAPPPKPQPSFIPPKATTTGASSLMPPPPVPRPRPTSQTNRLAPISTLQPPRLSGNSLGPPPSAAAAQRGLGLPNSGSRLSNSTLAPTQVSLKKPSSGKVILEPGFSPLDWAARAANPKNNLRGEGLPPGLLRITPSMLKEQHGRKGRDAWTSYHGKVYNISPYAPYHPGGKGELLRGAGKDSAQLFQEIHPWVNWEGILGECLVGILVSEHDIQAENALDAMD
ncbi:Cytochrome b5 [Penicillium cf. griseofulvum]|uniref:Cytochrome b5 n=1 Tax=Penicillium cf. griseofulvum TaxID=2972120 RepID=A0A9W9M0W0_9EURO|nr:Cytochrome b5 [Penicillium cf. griseofulvum]KAJ5430141.1 Cytochrome b5 [Penicillium cf. griseofulvum]KAJ5436088.1 Cytochrome b5 [Penicillium cf. griseofulvum]